MHLSFIDNLCGADLADTQLISKFNKGFEFLYVLLIFSGNMHGLFFSKRKTVSQLPMLFKKNLNETNHKSDEIWIDKGSEFFNGSEKSWLDKKCNT